MTIMVEALKDKKTVKIGDYTLTGKIGQGGVAVIYKGVQESLDREVAIKVLSTKMSNDEEIVRRFERESVVIGKLNHPNIVHVIDKGFAGGRYYFVMTYIEGTSFREVIDSDKINLRTKLDMMVQVCKALDYAHKNGVIHRDIKPTNILIDKQGNALVADFGIAQIVGSPETEMTSSEIIMGTLAYMSPEQKISSTNVDQTTDIYAMGVILYEILLGKKPLGHFKLPSELDSNINSKFDKVIQKCLAPEAKDRYQRAVELKDDLLDAMNGTDTSHSPAEDISLTDSESFMGKCRYLDTIKETRFSSTILVENRLNKKLYVIKKHCRGDHGRKEAKLLSSLKHKNIINIFGSGGDNKNTVIITEYASGGSLSDRMVRIYNWKDAFKIIFDIAAGLDHAHKNNIVHGNIRPSNILFDDKDNPKIADFGMPAHYEQHKRKNWYNPPEHKVSKQGDIYSLGVILHQMIAGRNPSYNSAGNIRLDDIKNNFPEAVYNIISKLMAIRVSRRYQTCEELLIDWDDFEKSQRDFLSKKVVVKAAPKQIEKEIPIWAYFVAVGLIIISVLSSLYFSGFFN